MRDCTQKNEINLPSQLDAKRELLTEAKFYGLSNLAVFIEKEISQQATLEDVQKRAFVEQLDSSKQSEVPQQSKDIPSADFVPSTNFNEMDDTLRDKFTYKVTQEQIEQTSGGAFCYMCKGVIDTPPSPNNELALLCSTCSDLNALKRDQLANMTGLVALVTGARVKIGYFTALKLLRCGALVIVTTRFPMDAATRFRKEADFEEWKNHLHIYGADLRHFPSVQSFLQHVSQWYTRMDILINNAAQTVRRPPAFYQHLVDRELAISESPDFLVKLIGENPFNTSSDTHSDLKAVVRSQQEIISLTKGFDVLGNTFNSLYKLPCFPAVLSQVKITEEDNLGSEELFPHGQLDSDGQQIDLRSHNSWNKTIEQVAPIEIIEVMMVNVIAPFLMISQLRELMLKDYNKGQNRPKFIINVSSPEGQFSDFKTSRHPHTNAAKAALNMITKSCSREFAEHSIFMNSVDTGWVSKMSPNPLVAIRKVPLTMDDAVARVLDPIFSAFKGNVLFGLFLRNFESVPW